MGHDIGHTPFGHQGERTLDEIMRGNDNLGGMIKHRIKNGGFKHNYNSLRVLDILEVKYGGENEEGLNLTWQVLEGIFKHTRHNNDKYDINRFISHPSRKDDLFLSKDYSVTLEGQVVAIADEIAQRQHDLDDGFRDPSLNIDFITFIKDILERIEYIESECPCRKYEKNMKCIIDLKGKLDHIKKGAESQPTNTRYQRYAKNKIIRDIINYFIWDVLITSQRNLKGAPGVNYSKSYKNIFYKKVIGYSGVGELLDEEIEKYIKDKIVNSYDVNRFDGKARYVIRQIFKAYYTNPRQMPKESLERISKVFLNLSKDCGYNIHQDLKEIDFSSSPAESIDNFLNLLKLSDDVDLIKIVGPKGTLDVEKLNLILSNNVEDGYPNFGEAVDKIRSDKIAGEYLGDTEKFIWYLGELNYVFLSVICDYIAGMTDNYAKKEYKELYLV